MKIIKYHSALFLFLLGFSFFSCNNNVDSNNQEMASLFQIHLQGGFSNTPVKVNVDYLEKFNDTITTNPSISLAAIIPVDIYKGTHLLRVTIADSITKDTTFTIKDTLYIGVSYNQFTFNIYYYFRHTPFPYR